MEVFIHFFTAQVGLFVRFISIFHARLACCMFLFAKCVDCDSAPDCVSHCTSILMASISKQTQASQQASNISKSQLF